MVEALIFHNADDPTKGIVDYKPYLCALPLATSDAPVMKSNIYPNPSNGNFVLDAQAAGNYVISDLVGRNIQSGIIVKGKNHISLNLKTGMYMIQVNANGKKETNKLIIK